MPSAAYRREAMSRPGSIAPESRKAGVRAAARMAQTRIRSLDGLS